VRVRIKCCVRCGDWRCLSKPYATILMNKLISSLDRPKSQLRVRLFI